MSIPLIRRWPPAMLPENRWQLRGRAAVLACLLLWAGACGGPNYNRIANDLRAKNREQARQIATLKDELKNRDATIATLRSKEGPSIPTLPQDRLEQLFTATRLEIRSTSDTWDDGDGKGTSAFRVFVRMYSKDGQLLPSSGTMTVEAFELPPAPAQPRRIGMWVFGPEHMKKNWYSGLGLNHFAFTCPWESPPTQPTVTFKVTFQDLLTGNSLTAQLDKKITPPSAAVAP